MHFDSSFPFLLTCYPRLARNCHNTITIASWQQKCPEKQVHFLTDLVSCFHGFSRKRHLPCNVRIPQCYLCIIDSIFVIVSRILFRVCQVNSLKFLLDFDWKFLQTFTLRFSLKLSRSNRRPNFGTRETLL